jgi:hypothetical protein
MSWETNKSIRYGRAGEYFAAYILEKNGAESYRVDGAFDLISFIGNNLVRIEVKTATCNYKTAYKVGQYRFYKSKTHSALIPTYTFLVALDRSLLRICKGYMFSKRTTLTVSGSQFTEEAMQKDVDYFMHELKLDGHSPEHSIENTYLKP